MDAMEAWSDQEGVQCNGCLALMSLVRGVGEACQVRPPLGTCVCSNATAPGGGLPGAAASGHLSVQQCYSTWRKLDRCGCL